MNKLPNTRYSGLLACIALAALALRSLIPMGYMPDFSGHGLLVICDGTDHLTASAGHDPACPHHHKGVCPFGAAVLNGFEGAKEPHVVPPVYHLAMDDFHQPHLFVRPGDYGNASPRSPPHAA